MYFCNLSLYNDFIKVKNLQKSFFEQLLIKLNDWKYDTITQL